MRRHLKRRMTNGDLEQMGGSYEGVIVEVVLEKMRNPFTTKSEVNPVVSFEDGWRIVPNIGMRRALTENLGPDTDGWIGRQIRVFLRPVQRRAPSGDGKQRLEKAVECLDAPAAEPETAEREELAAAEITWG